MEPATRFPENKDPLQRGGRFRLLHRLAVLIILICPLWWSLSVYQDFSRFSEGLPALANQVPDQILDPRDGPEVVGRSQEAVPGEESDPPWQKSGVVSGKFPLHIYHAFLGARTLATSGRACAYDPQFHAGYLKTPLYDTSARPLEGVLSFLYFGDFPSLADAARIQGWLVALITLFTPFLVSQAARWGGMPRAASVVAGLLALFVMTFSVWRETLASGAIDRLAGAPLVLAHLGLLLHYHRHPSPLALGGITLTHTLCWLFDPLLTVVSLPVQLWIYLRTGMKHGAAWHLGLLVSFLIGTGCNFSYLVAWQKYWWIRVAPRWENAFFPRGIFSSLIGDKNWGQNWELALGLWLIVLGLLGGLSLRASGRRLQSAVFSLILGSMLGLYGLGQAFVELGKWDTGSLLPAVLIAACIPAGGILAGMPCRGRKKRGEPGAQEVSLDPNPRPWIRRIPSIAALGVLAAILFWNPLAIRGLVDRVSMLPALRSDLTGSEASTVAFLAGLKPGKGRVLWEMVPADDQRNWAILLPIWTGHSLIGGLDSTPRIEHMQSGLFDGRLAGKPLREWTAESFLAYCRTYQVAWVTARQPTTREWLMNVPGLKLESDERGAEGEPEAVVFSVPGPGENVALVGSARLVSADPEQLILADVVPSRGQVVLSFHYQTGLVASPNRVEVERELDYRDPIPLIRLRMDEPATRLQIRWAPP